MIESHVDIKTKDGVMPAFTARPEEPGDYPAIVLYFDAPGVREELRNFIRRIAGQGYFAILPDLYYRLGKLSFNIAERTEAINEMIHIARDTLSNAMVMEDTKHILEYLDGNPNVKAGAKGCIGYCMSGRFIVTTAGAYPDHFAACASLYGVQIVTDEADSPHLIADRIRGELYLGFAEIDPLIPDNVIPDLTTALDKNGVAYRCEVHPDTRHGFCFPERPVYKEDAAEDVWKKVFEMFDRILHVNEAVS
jgi:carboxymethylenebutenolidase